MLTCLKARGNDKKQTTYVLVRALYMYSTVVTNRLRATVCVSSIIRWYSIAAIQTHNLVFYGKGSLMINYCQR